MSSECRQSSKQKLARGQRNPVGAIHESPEPRTRRAGQRRPAKASAAFPSPKARSHRASSASGTFVPRGAGAQPLPPFWFLFPRWEKELAPGRETSPRHVIPSEVEESFVGMPPAALFLVCARNRGKNAPGELRSAAACGRKRQSAISAAAPLAGRREAGPGMANAARRIAGPWTPGFLSPAHSVRSEGARLTAKGPRRALRGRRSSGATVQRFGRFVKRPCNSIITGTITA